MHYPTEMQMYHKPTFTNRLESSSSSSSSAQQYFHAGKAASASSVHMNSGYRYAKQSTRHQMLAMDQLSDHSTSCGSESSEEYFTDSTSYSPPANLAKKQSKIGAGYFNNNNNITNSIQNNNNNNNQTVIPEEAKYKTEMCKNWVEIGKCNYGEKCKFAHGKNELVQKMAANKHFKTKPCKQFFETGICHYGPRCHFLHDTRPTPVIGFSQFYSKKINHPELFLNTTTNISTFPSQHKRLDIFEKLTSQSQLSQQSPQDFIYQPTFQL